MNFVQQLRDFPTPGFTNYKAEFQRLANLILNNYLLHAGSLSYRILECEVYCKMPGHKDPYIHGREEQYQSGTWYFNDFGLDLTFGNKKKEIQASFLIRGIRELSNMPEYTSGPARVVRRLFSGMGSAFTNNGGLYLDPCERFPDNQIYTATRVNLPENETDFRNRPYRYIVELQQEHKFPGKEALVRELWSEGNITAEEVKKALGYAIHS